jgi:prophage regulatory protein
LGRSAIYQKVADGEFPAPVKISERCVAWVQSEVDAWTADRIAERDAAAA